MALSVIKELGCTNTDKDTDTDTGTGMVRRHKKFLFGTPNEVSMHPTKGTQRVTIMI